MRHLLLELLQVLLLHLLHVLLELELLPGQEAARESPSKSSKMAI